MAKCKACKGKRYIKEGKLKMPCRACKGTGEAPK